MKHYLGSKASCKQSFVLYYHMLYIRKTTTSRKKIKITLKNDSKFDLIFFSVLQNNRNNGRSSVGSFGGPPRGRPSGNNFPISSNRKGRKFTQTTGRRRPISQHVNQVPRRQSEIIIEFRNSRQHSNPKIKISRPDTRGRSSFDKGKQLQSSNVLSTRERWNSKQQSSRNEHQMPRGNSRPRGQRNEPILDFDLGQLNQIRSQTDLLHHNNKQNHFRVDDTHSSNNHINSIPVDINLPSEVLGSVNAIPVNHHSTSGSIRNHSGLMSHSVVDSGLSGHNTGLSRNVGNIAGLSGNFGNNIGLSGNIANTVGHSGNVGNDIGLFGQGGNKAGLSGHIGEKVRLSVQGGHGTVLPGQSGLNIGLSGQTGHHDNELSGHGGQHAGLSASSVHNSQLSNQKGHIAAITDNKLHAPGISGISGSKVGVSTQGVNIVDHIHSNNTQQNIPQNARIKGHSPLVTNGIKGHNPLVTNGINSHPDGIRVELNQIKKLLNGVLREHHGFMANSNSRMAAGSQINNNNFPSHSIHHQIQRPVASSGRSTGLKHQIHTSLQQFHTLPHQVNSALIPVSTIQTSVGLNSISGGNIPPVHSATSLGRNNQGANKLIATPAPRIEPIDIDYEEILQKAMTNRILNGLHLRG